MSTSTSTYARVASLKSLWGQWTAIVDLFARRDVARREVKAEDYRALQAGLLEACHANRDAKLTEFARRAAEIARPWMSLESLNEAPTKILEDLQRSCLLAEGRPSGGGRRLSSRRWLHLVVFITVFVGAGLVTLIAMEPSGRAGGKAGVLDRLSQVEQPRNISRLTNDGRLGWWVIGVAGGTVTAIMTYCVFRAPKQS